MRKSSTNSKVESTDTIDIILQSLPDPKDNSVSTIKDEVFVNDKRVIYLAQKSKGSQGFYWNIYLS
jgi:hypothetical protein